MSISPINTSISQVSRNNAYSVRVGSSKNVFKQGHIFLNGKKVLISASIRDTAHNINKMSAQTGVKAKIVRDARGDERLVLISSKKIVNISDPNRILADLFRKNKIGKGDDKLIQIEGNKGIGIRVKINYSNNKPITQLDQYLKLSNKVAKDYDGISSHAKLFNNGITNHSPVLSSEEQEVSVNQVSITENTHPNKKGNVQQVIFDEDVSKTVIWSEEQIRIRNEKVAQVQEAALRDVSNFIAKAVFDEVIKVRRLINTTDKMKGKVIVNISSTLIRTGLSALDIKNYQKILITKISEQVDSRRSFLKSAFYDELDISTNNIEESVIKGLQLIFKK